jgi:hypothetical protein
MSFWTLLRAAAVLAVALDFFTPEGGLFQANAQASNDCTGTNGGACTITSSSAVALVIPSPANYLVIDNESASATIACAFANGTAALNTAGSYTVGPAQTRVWDFVHSGKLLAAGNLNCISSAGTSPATIEVR